MTTLPFSFPIKMGHPRTCEHRVINAVKKEIHDWVKASGITAPVRIGWYEIVETEEHSRLRNAKVRELGDFPAMRDEGEKAHGQLTVRCSDENALAMIKLRFG